MIELRFIKEDKDKVIEQLEVKNFKGGKIIEEILTFDTERLKFQVEFEKKTNEQKTLSTQLFVNSKTDKSIVTDELNEKILRLKKEIRKLAISLKRTKIKIERRIIKIPNLPHQSVPKGKTPEDNVEIRAGGAIPKLAEDAMPHWDLAKKFDIIDFELGVKITGAGFPVYKDKGSKLQRALINFFLDQNTKAGYVEITPPLMVNEDSGYGTGQLPDKEGQMYHAGLDNFYLIPTAEVPVTNIYRDVILEAGQLPIKNTAYTPCFRREAGSYGKDVRGLNRLHQFDKVEIVQIQHPDKSYQALEEMAKHVESIIKMLDLPYRIIKLCGGDMSFTSALTYDFEVYATAQKKWLEVSSVSNFESFQANRLKLRFKDSGDKKTRLAHTLNGSSLALPRIVAALLENNQTDRGINIPEALVPYTGFSVID